MLQLTPQSTIFVATEPIDFRKGYDGLVAVCKLKFAQDPFSGNLFVFYNRSRTSFKILFFDGQGLCIFAKRLSQGRFTYKDRLKNTHLCYRQICYRALHILINNGDPDSAKLGKNWRT